jgi:hypothetical protein
MKEREILTEEEEDIVGWLVVTVKAFGGINRRWR